MWDIWFLDLIVGFDDYLSGGVHGHFEILDDDSIYDFHWILGVHHESYNGRDYTWSMGSPWHMAHWKALDSNLMDAITRQFLFIWLCDTILTLSWRSNARDLAIAILPFKFYIGCWSHIKEYLMAKPI